LQNRSISSSHAFSDIALPLVNATAQGECHAFFGRYLLVQR
jgi:hypothetical protein